MTDKLPVVHFPSLRPVVLKAISDYRRRDALAKVIREFFTALKAEANVNRTLADKLFKKLVDEHPDLRVFRVLYTKEDLITGSAVYKFTVQMYEMDTDLGNAKFTLAKDAAGQWAIDNMLIADTRWGLHADFLESKLKSLPYAAERFNKAREEMRKYAESMSLPPGENFPVWPLSDAFSYYRLT